VGGDGGFTWPPSLGVPASRGRKCLEPRRRRSVQGERRKSSDELGEVKKQITILLGAGQGGLNRSANRKRRAVEDSDAVPKGRGFCRV